MPHEPLQRAIKLLISDYFVSRVTQTSEITSLVVLQETFSFSLLPPSSVFSLSPHFVRV